MSTTFLPLFTFIKRGKLAIYSTIHCSKTFEVFKKKESLFLKEDREERGLQAWLRG